MTLPSMFRKLAKLLSERFGRLAAVMLGVGVSVVALSMTAPLVIPSFSNKAVFAALPGVLLLIWGFGLLFVSLWFGPADDGLQTRGVLHDALDWYKSIFLVIWFAFPFTILLLI